MTMRELIIEILAQAYSNCTKKQEAIGVSKVVRAVITETDMSNQEEKEFVYKIYDRLHEIGYDESVFPVNEEEYYKSKHNTP